MATWQKDTLYPGDWHLSDGRVFECPPAMVERLQQRVAEMLAAGVPIPLMKEHQDKKNLLTAAQHKANRVDHCLGWTTASKLHADGFMECEGEVPDDEDAKKLPACRFVSPGIDWDVKDGSGRIWPGPSIYEFAVTPRPIQIKQKAFKLIRLSADAQPTGPLFLSLDGWRPLEFSETPHGNSHHGSGKNKGATMKTRTVMRPIKLAATQDKPERTVLRRIKLAEGEEAKDDDFEVEAESEEGGEHPAVAEGNIKLKKVVECLAEHGLVLGEGVTPENLLERLYVSCETKKAHTAGTEETTTTETETPAPVEDTMNPVAMAAKQAAKPVKLSAAEQRILKRDREDMVKRLGACLRTGRMDKPTYDRLLAQLTGEKAIKLSLAESGELEPNDVSTYLAVHEGLPKGAVWTPAVRLAAEGEPEPVEPPTDRKDPEPLDEEVVNKLSGGRWKQYKDKKGA